MIFRHLNTRPHILVAQDQTTWTTCRCCLDDRARAVPLPLAQLVAHQRRGKGLRPVAHVRRPRQKVHLRGGPAAPLAQVAPEPNGGK